MTNSFVILLPDAAAPIGPSNHQRARNPPRDLAARAEHRAWVSRTLAGNREVGYSTVLKFMQIMTEKGTLLRDESVRPQVYRAARPRRDTQRFLVRDLIARVFGGSSASLVMQALSDQKATPDERRQIRELLDTLDGKGSRTSGSGKVPK